MTPATDRNTGSVSAELLTPRVATRRPSSGTIMSMEPYLEMTAAAKAIAAPINHLETTVVDTRVTHHIDTASQASAATSYTAKWARAMYRPLRAKASAHHSATDWPNRFSAVLANATSVIVDRIAAMNRAPGSPPSR